MPGPDPRDHFEISDLERHAFGLAAELLATCHALGLEEVDDGLFRVTEAVVERVAERIATSRFPTATTHGGADHGH